MKTDVRERERASSGAKINCWIWVTNCHAMADQVRLGDFLFTVNRLITHALKDCMEEKKSKAFSLTARIMWIKLGGGSTEGKEIHQCDFRPLNLWVMLDMLFEGKDEFKFK